jgi:hypothetical protein
MWEAEIEKIIVLAILAKKVTECQVNKQNQVWWFKLKNVGGGRWQYCVMRLTTEKYETLPKKKNCSRLLIFMRVWF